MIIRNNKNQPFNVSSDSEDISILHDPQEDIWIVSILDGPAMALTIRHIEDLKELCEAVEKDVSK